MINEAVAKQTAPRIIAMASINGFIMSVPTARAMAMGTGSQRKGDPELQEDAFRTGNQYPLARAD